MSTLLSLITIAAEEKPAMGEPCNHCGWCCLTEICPIGLEWTDKTIGPCPLLVQQDPNQKHYDSTKHYCSLALQTPEIKKEIGAGSGCCAETQNEALARFTKCGAVA